MGWVVENPSARAVRCFPVTSLYPSLDGFCCCPAPWSRFYVAIFVVFVCFCLVLAVDDDIGKCRLMLMLVVVDGYISYY
jgi:hypothetical protein